MVKSKVLYSQGYNDAMVFDNTVKLYSNDPDYQSGYTDGVKDRQK